MQSQHWLPMHGASSLASPHLHPLLHLPCPQAATAERLKKAEEERGFLKQLADSLLANQKDFQAGGWVLLVASFWRVLRDGRCQDGHWGVAWMRAVAGAALPLRLGPPCHRRCCLRVQLALGLPCSAHRCSPARLPVCLPARLTGAAQGGRRPAGGHGGGEGCGHCRPAGAGAQAWLLPAC